MGLSGSLGGSSSFKESMALSFGKDVADLLEYSIGRFSSSTDSEATIAAPSSVRLESTFCRNFTCCGRELDDLHDLLQHYEECHVRFEDEDEDEIQNIITDEELENSSMASDAAASTNASAESPLASPTSTKVHAPAAGADRVAELKRGRPLNDAATPMVVTAAEDLESPSAFDTAVMRSPSTSRGKKRAFGQPNMGGGSGANPLYRALVDGGVTRHPFNVGNIYSPSSPFSTPGSSRAGTPSLDSDNESFFGSTTQPSVFSNLSLRGTNAEEHQLPSCAPPNLFFPSAAANASNRPAKRERFNPSGTSAAPAAAGSAASAAGNGSPLPTDSSAGEHRPYKCPAPGCDKAYKQMNGLKYHRLHGHCNQNLRNVNNGLVMPTNENGPTPSGPQTPSKEGEAGAAAPDAKTPSGQGPDLAAFGIHSTGAPLGGGGDAPREAPSTPTKMSAAGQPEKTYVCQVGNCDKRYKNLNGLRYHYLHSGSHGLLGLQLLHANGGGASAKADSVSGRPPVSTETLSREQIVQAAAAAQALLNQQAQAQCAKNPATPGAQPSSAAFLAALNSGNMSMTSGAQPP
ncbi:Transcriptional regulator of ribosomal biogenesis proteins [Malassezia obtusa]|uniref:Transcriptional regulator of ribosomal biogenesis proteins n=1 Tax=Malassezia obtusa TaxID=76774 RepID=A0AAF0DYJ2_9BASI|nr:Transcriptional regulator of ribosomal biogenesis proteins [Malassezia obtusa]